MVLGGRKCVLSREVSSVQGCPYSSLCTTQIVNEMLCVTRTSCVYVLCVKTQQNCNCGHCAHFCNEQISQIFDCFTKVFTHTHSCIRYCVLISAVKGSGGEVLLVSSGSSEE